MKLKLLLHQFELAPLLFCPLVGRALTNSIEPLFEVGVLVQSFRSFARALNRIAQTHVSSTEVFDKPAANKQNWLHREYCQACRASSW